MPDVLPRTEKEKTQRHTEGRLGKDIDEDWNDISASQGMPRAASSHQKLGEKCLSNSPLEPPKEPTLPTF